jgi:hypothetical protein
MLDKPAWDRKKRPIRSNYKTSLLPDKPAVGVEMWVVLSSPSQATILFQTNPRSTRLYLVRVVDRELPFDASSSSVASKTNRQDFLASIQAFDCVM